jgi:DtxR family manganese transport transcriptional regulator
MERAIPFKATRNNRLNEVTEDYTELIDSLVESQSEARVCDIARELGVSHVSVLKTLKRLTRDGYLKDSSRIELTEKGKQTGQFARRKHQILKEFLLKLGVPESIVDIDVEGIEHYISQTTLEAIHAYVKNHF